jgi:SAM-dependent MidA family methyltransferase
MDDWLYGEEGYYKNIGQVGKKGDFLTSPSVSMFFGGALANKFLSLVREGALPKNAVICEFGANSLYALKDFASFLAGLAPQLLQSVKFVIVEKQADAAQFQKKELQEFFADVDFEVVDSLEGYEDREAFVFANEIFDAFSCELFFEGKIAVVDSNMVVFEQTDAVISQKAEALGVAKGEIALGYEEFAAMLHKAFKKSYFVTFDYGQEYARNDFSARIYKEHTTEPLFAIDDLKPFFAKSDITYDVNFSHLKNAFTGAGFEFLEYKNQASALVDFGISDLLSMYGEKTTQEAYMREVAKAKALISPEGFGERFKMISFAKGLK